MGWFSRLYESELLRELVEAERVALQQRTQRLNLTVARALSPVLVCVALLMCVIDVQRFRSGKFVGSWLYQSLAWLHLVFLGSVLLALWLLANKNAVQGEPNRTLRAHIVLLLTSLLGMAVLGIVERSSFVVLAGSLLSANFIYRVPLQLRSVFNLSAFVLCTLVVALDDSLESIPRTIRITEVFALVAAPALVGGLQARQFVTSVTAEYRLTHLVLMDALGGDEAARRGRALAASSIAELPLAGRIGSALRGGLSVGQGPSNAPAAEAAIARQLEILRAVATRTKNAVVVTDAQGRIEWVNDTFPVLTGYSLDEVRREIPGRILQGPATDPLARTLMAAAIKAHRPFAQEVLNYAKDGRQYWVMVEAEPTFGHGGEFTGYVAIETDTTTQRLNEQFSACLRRVANLLLSCDSVEEAGRTVTESLTLTLDLPVAQFWLANEHEECLQHCYGFTLSEDMQPWLELSAGLSFRRGMTWAVGVGAPGVAWATEKTCLQVDIWEYVDDGVPSRRAEVAQRLGLRTVCAVPVRGPGGVMGIIEVAGAQGFPGYEQIPDVIERVANQLGAFLTQHQHLKAAEQANQELRHQISRRSAQLFSTMSTADVSGPTPVVFTPGLILDDRYRIISPLGKGAMGEVFEVERITDNTRWALKTTFSAHAEVRARLLREAHLLSRVRHPNVVQVADVDAIQGGVVYLVLEFVKGMDLKAWRLSGTQADLSQKREILTQVLRGLSALHAQGIAHRDLKPQNILLAQVGPGLVAKLADFGISRAVSSSPAPEALLDESTTAAQPVERNPSKPIDDDATTMHSVPEPLAPAREDPRDSSAREVPSPTTTIMEATAITESKRETPLTGEARVAWERTTADLAVTQAGAIAGTPLYLAPELLNPGASLFVADMFSFGVLAFELLHERHPFGAPVVGQTRPKVAPANGACGDAALDRLVLDCLSFEPARRPTADDALASLKGAVQCA
ncbi:MAG: protein kinase domain-containing protein [Myxococcota bacterium]